MPAIGRSQRDSARPAGGLRGAPALDVPAPSFFVVAAVVLLALAPLVAYAWVAIDADRITRLGVASDRNTSVARLVAGALSERCQRTTRVLRGVALLCRQQTGPKQNGRVLRVLRTVQRDVLKVDAIVLYRTDGSIVATAPDRPAVSSRGETALWLAAVASRHPPEAADVVAAAGRPRIALAVAARGAWGDGFLVAYTTCRRMVPWIGSIETTSGKIRVVDARGEVIAGNGSDPPMSPKLDLVAVPGGSSVVGTADVPTLRCQVVAAMPVDADLMPTNLLAARLSLLIVPIMLGFALAASYRMRAVAMQLAAQNQALRTADRTKSEFLANISHDLRTPLAGMHLSISGLLDPAMKWSADETNETLQTMDRELYRLTLLVRNLLDMSRIEARVDEERREPADLTDLVGAALERVEPMTRGRHIRADFPREPLMVDCDPGQIETVLVNLLENALKYSLDGKPIALSGAVHGDRVVFTIRDRGPGLKPGDEERIFEKFYRGDATRSAEGSGLGLAIARAVIEAHGGEIGARRAAGGGAEFWFALRAAGPGSGVRGPGTAARRSAR